MPHPSVSTQWQSSLGPGSHLFWAEPFQGLHLLKRHGACQWLGLKPSQAIFFIVGLPGLILAVLMFTVIEPTRKGVKAPQHTGSDLRLTLDKSLLDVRKVWITLLCHIVKNCDGIHLVKNENSAMIVNALLAAHGR